MHSQKKEASSQKRPTTKNTRTKKVDSSQKTAAAKKTLRSELQVENPATGLLKTRPFMERLPWVDVTYCKYGTPYRKQTRLWTNMRWRPSRGLCRSGSRCDAWEDGRHLRGAQGGPQLMGGQRERVRGQSRELLYSIPTALCEEIARAATAELADRQSIPD